ncbi:MAG: DUF192 domain-containing protein [Gammaproteobacteria bacterium]|nr:DUF192 domain-containing protein [Gammaproteobacteria bacterium]
MRLQSYARNLRLALALCMLVIPSTSNLVGQLASPLYERPQQALRIHTTDGSIVHLKTVIVSNREDMRRGLMHVTHLPLNMTMLFVYERPRPASMWMKNTLISLDMWWIDTNFTVQHIAHQTKPLSLDPIGLDEPVRAVLEINAGLSRMLGVSKGAKVELVR